MDTRVLLDGTMWYLVFVVSTTCHEAAHAWVGLLGGDRTAADAGQVTLSPGPHMRREPVGMIVVPILSYVIYAAQGAGGWMIGWASAPYDPIWAARYPRRSALMALSGPVANFLLAGIAFAALKIGLAADWFTQPEGRATISQLVEGEGLAHSVGHFLSILLMLNVLLGVFNLLPVPPLDGHAVVPLFLSPRATESWHEAMRTIGMFGILLAWIALSRIWPWLHSTVLELLHPGTIWR
jgi:Zn-dependent protease